MRFLACAAAALLLAVPAWADDKPKEKAKSYEIPYKLTSTNHIMVRLKLNGKGPFNFIVDTGAPALFVATKIAKKAGCEPDKEGWGTFDTFEMEGGLKLKDVRGKIDDPFQLEGMNGLGIAGVELHGMIGYNLLAKYKITYDFTSDKLGLTELPGFKPQDTPSFGGGGQGGLELIGKMMKLIGGMMGFKGPPERKPRGYLGVDLEATKDAVTVRSVMPDSPADKAGLKVGDKIVNFDGKTIDRLTQLIERASKHPAGNEITIAVERDGSEKRITLTLGKGL
jgi:hypothetical protein